MIDIFERFLVIFLFVALLVGVSPAESRADGRLRIIVYGDSLTSGYGMQLDQAYGAKLERKLREVGFTGVEVINMSVSGETTSGGLERINSLLVQQPDIVLLELGANDAIRGINIELIYTNLHAIISQLIQRNIYVILLGMKAPPNTGPIYSSRFEDIYRGAAKHYKIPFYPFFLDSIYGRPDMNLADGYHPNAKGVEVLVDYTYPLIDDAVRWKIQVQEYQRKTGGGDEPMLAPMPPPAMRQ